LVKFVQKNTNTTFVKVGSKKTLHSLFGKVCLKKTLLQITFGKGWFKKTLYKITFGKSWFKKTTHLHILFGKGWFKKLHTSHLVKVGSKNTVIITFGKGWFKKTLNTSHLLNSLQITFVIHFTNHIW
jgi:hypothetical protein